jgi:flagellar FliL protein
MSAQAAAPTVADAVPPAPRGGATKLILVGAIALLLVLLLAGGALYWLKVRAAHAEDADADSDTPAATARARNDPTHPPTFLPLDMFVVNLADKDSDRYAQVGIVLEVESPAFAEQMRAYMPAVRNAVLMILAHKTSRELLEREGKEQLAAEIMRETVRPMGIEIAAPSPVSADADKPGAGDDDEVDKRASRKAKRPVRNPIHHVHFSSFIIQ